MTALLSYRRRHFLQELEACRNKPLLVGSCFLKWVSRPGLAARPLRITGRRGVGLSVTVHQTFHRVCARSQACSHDHAHPRSGCQLYAVSLLLGAVCRDSCKVNPKQASLRPSLTLLKGLWLFEAR